MKKLFVICGHGSGDPGACGNGYQEAERVRVLGKKIKALGGDAVMLADVNRNYYKDNGISKLTISKDYQIIELHMDSGPSSARGAHVIIKQGLKADQYDKELADFLYGMFPGRANKLVGRADLANPNRAAARGYGYRLVECGFISNPLDVKKFNENINEIARGILKCFGIAVSEGNMGSPQNGGSGMFLVKTLCDLNIRKTAAWGDNVVGVAKPNIYTIVETKIVDGVQMGRLKSGAGWISIHSKYVERV